MNNHIKSLRLKFFFVTAAICIALVGILCATLFVALNTQNEQNFVMIERHWKYNPELEVPNNPGDFPSREERIQNMQQMRDEANRSLLLTVLSIGGGSLAILLTLAWFLAYWIVRPTKLSWQKQQRFISEASHELKTPLAIISAGVDLKKYQEVKKQVDSMNILITDLLTLSKLDEANKIEKQEFNLSQTILTETLSFESLAFEQTKNIVTEIDEDIKYKGNAANVVQALKILLDNAIKYSDEYSDIVVKLTKTILSVSNTGAKITERELPFIFERFYRGAESRGEIDGTGLGLSILKNFADINNWKLHAELEGSRITFIINL
jgi:signal transduction histidine kinase